MRNEAWYVMEAMQGGQPMPMRKIYMAVQAVWRRYDYEPPMKEWKSEIRRILQRHCPSCKDHNGKDDFFIHHRRDVWSCKIVLQKPKIEDLA
jgi:hypothetical protein